MGKNSRSAMKSKHTMTQIRRPSDFKTQFLIEYTSIRNTTRPLKLTLRQFCQDRNVPYSTARQIILHHLL